MLSAADQLARLEQHLLSSGGVPVGSSSATVDGSDQIGVLNLTVEYPRGHRLYVSVTVDATPGWPMWPHYSFHLQRPDGQPELRYDNAPHYPAMATFPHHRHVGPSQTPEEASPPTIRAILVEVLRSVAQDQ